MRVCGIDLSGNKANLVILEGDSSNYHHINVKPCHIDLVNDEDQAPVKLFMETIFTFFRENRIEFVGIKKRNKKGEYAGGPLGFKLEGLIQVYPNCEVKLIHPTSIAAVRRKLSPTIPAGLYQYQEDAYFTALATLS